MHTRGAGVRQHSSPLAPFHSTHPPHTRASYLSPLTSPTPPPAEQKAREPRHLSSDIPSMTSHQQSYSATAVRQMDYSAAAERQLRLEESAAAAKAAAEAAAAAEEAARFRKDPKAPSLHGGFEERRLKNVTVGGSSKYHDSTVAAALGPAPPLPEKPPSPEPEAAAGSGGEERVATGDGRFSPSSPPQFEDDMSGGTPRGKAALPPLVTTQTLNASYGADGQVGLPPLPPMGTRLHSLATSSE